MADALVKNCPVCAKPPNLTFHPFCSARCAQIDLGRWLGENYRVPTHEAPSDNLSADEE